MMIKYAQYTASILAFILLTACSSNQRFIATGPITLTDDSTVLGMLYWDQLVGKTWYGTPLEASSTDVRLKMCNRKIIDKHFNVSSTNNTLQLKRRSKDTNTHNIDHKGRIQAINSQEVASNNSCAQIWLNNKNASLSDLNAQGEPTIYVTCKSKRKDRYPKAGKYTLSSISSSAIGAKAQRPTCPQSSLNVAQKKSNSEQLLLSNVNSN